MTRAVCAVLLVLAIGGCGETPEEKANRAFTEARASAESAQWTKVVVALDTVLQVHPEDVEARRLLARAYAEQGFHPQARDGWKALTERPGATADDFARLAAEYVALGEHEPALAAFDAVLARDADDAAAKLGRARALDTLGREREAHEAYAPIVQTADAPLGARVAFARLSVALSRPAALHAVSGADARAAVDAAITAAPAASAERAELAALDTELRTRAAVARARVAQDEASRAASLREANSRILGVLQALGGVGDHSAVWEALQGADVSDVMGGLSGAAISTGGVGRDDEASGMGGGSIGTVGGFGTLGGLRRSPPRPPTEGERDSSGQVRAE